MYDFILSTKKSLRVKRHLAFWLVIIFFYTAQFCFEHYKLEISFFENLLVSLKFIPSKIFLTNILFCYPVVYFLVPKLFLKKRSFLFVINLIIISATVFIIRSSYIYYYFQLTPADRFSLFWGGLIDFIFVGPFSVCLIFIAIKMLKAGYIKEEENRQLITANANAEQQFLKAQIHPHFLFNTLNNIYSFTLNKSSKADEMVLQLSDMMRYMINDCATEFVPLDKELKMMDDYIGLEKVRYGNRLDMQIEITGDIENKKIVPLLMIPFIENSFKHGTSKMLRDPWIKLFIQADENLLHFTLTNSKPSEGIISNKGGIGLNNVKKRLQLLYPSNHLLTIESTINTFTVNMQIPLQQISEADQFATNETMFIN